MNNFEKSLIFRIKHIIPSAIFTENTRKDQVELFYKENYCSISSKRTFNPKLQEENCKKIVSYISDEDINEMKNLFKVVLQENKEIYKNILLIETGAKAKSYDLGIIIIGNNSYMLILILIIVSRENYKFGRINSKLDKDIFYLTSKINYIFPNYKSAGIHLVYVFDNNNESVIHELNNIKIETSNEKQNNYNMKEIIFEDKK